MPTPLRYPAWQESYLTAMLEMNSAAIKGKIISAEEALHLRLASKKTEPEERQAILDALGALKFLNR
jgi:hypothetical protein